MPDLLERVTGFLAVTLDVFTQKIRLRGLPAIDSIGGPAEGLTYIVTGPTSGIGKETAAALLRRKAHGQGYTQSKDGFELHMATNYLGPFLLTMLLLPSLRRSGTKDRPARVVNLASKMADTCTLNMRDPQLSRPNAWGGVYAYSHSKLCQVIATAEMRRRLAGDSRVFVCALDPGEAITSVTRTIPGWADYIYRVVLKSVLLTPEQGARSSVHCATCKDIVQQNRPSQCFINFTCKPIRPKPRFVDPVAGKWLWRWSAETISLPAELDLPEQLTAKTA